MPELPEVETIRRYMTEGHGNQPSLLGFEIVGAQLLWDRSLAMPTKEQFLHLIQGEIIEAFGRRGKYLILHLTKRVVLFHLRMSGDLWVERQDNPTAPHHRLLIDFKNGFRLAFNDPRKFGRVWLVDHPDEVTKNLGPEPLDPCFTPVDFLIRLKRHRRMLKPLLMDQSFLAGLGNIYTDEALNLAQLHPQMNSEHISAEKAETLLKAVRSVLKEGIRRNGASIDWVYRGGDYQNFLRVYGRAGKTCRECNTEIQRMIVGQRSTYYCPNCQVKNFKNDIQL